MERDYGPCRKKDSQLKWKINMNKNITSKTKKGYIKVYSPYHPFAKNGYVLEHRLVVEKKIKRFLTPEEVIHHIDEVKSNNDIENLMLFENNKAHMKFHTKIRQFGMTNPIKRQIANRWEDINNQKSLQ